MRPFLIMPKCSSLSISFWITFFFFSIVGYGLTKNGVSSLSLRWTSMKGHVPISSYKLKTWKSSVFIRNSSFPLSSNVESSRFYFCQIISESVMCLHLSSGSSHGYWSSFVGISVSSVILSVHVNILGISDGSIDLSSAKGCGLRVVGVTLLCKYWSIWKCLELLACARPFDLALK